jgi:hypothetical protein
MSTKWREASARPRLHNVVVLGLEELRGHPLEVQAAE